MSALTAMMGTLINTRLVPKVLSRHDILRAYVLKMHWNYTIFTKKSCVRYFIHANMYYTLIPIIVCNLLIHIELT